MPKQIWISSAFMELIFISLISKYSLFYFLCEWAWYVWIVCMYICASESPYMSVQFCFYAYFVEGEGKTLSVGPPPLPWLKQSLTVQCKFLRFFCLHLQSYHRQPGITSTRALDRFWWSQPYSSLFSIKHFIYGVISQDLSEPSFTSRVYSLYIYNFFLSSKYRF